MADLNKESLKRELIHTGAWGDHSKRWWQYAANAAAVADVIFLGIIPAETDVTDLTLWVDALGGGATLDIGYMNDDETVADYFFAAQDVAAAGRFVSDAKPKHIEKRSYLIATVQGAAITGAIDTLLGYLNRGGH